MANHIKPTAEELDAQIAASLQELEKEEPVKDAPIKEEQKEEEKPAGDEKAAEEEEKEGEEKEEKPIIKEEQKEEEKPDDAEDKSSIDYKKKFAESSRESIILLHQSKKLVKAIKEAGALPDPTDDEMKVEYTDWDLMDDAQKKMAKETAKNKRALAALGTVVQETENIEAWNTKVDEYISDPKTLQAFPGLEGREDDFKVFSSKETRRGADFEILTNAFLHTVQDIKIKHKGSMFEKPSGGPSDKLKKKSDKISLSDAENIKKTDYKRWLQLLKDGKIESDVD